MSKTVKRKITVELPKPRDLSKNRLSVFQRLGTKKLKSLETAVNINAKPKETKITTTVTANVAPEPKPDNVELEDADPDSLEKKRAELQKELELQLKMESSRKVATKEIIRKRKKPRSSSSSSSSSSDSGSSSDSSSSTSSKESKRKIRKGKLRKRGSSSNSSDEPRKKLVKVKRVCHKKVDGTKSHKSNHGKKLLEGKLRKRSQSPALRKRVGSSPPKSVQKIPIKNKLSVDNVAKHHRMKEAARDREREFQLRDREREKDKDRERMRSRERVRSRSPKMRPKSRTPKRLSSRDLKHKSPPPRRIGGSSGGGSMRRDRSIDRVVKKDFKRHDSRERERERREKERLCREDAREAAREKERQEILARCQERHERERLAREKLRRERDDDRMKPERLLPRPAERDRAIAAARDRSRDKSIDRDRLRSVSHSRSGRERMEREKEPNPYDRVYETHDRRIVEKDDRGVIRDERDYIRRHEDGRPESISSPYLAREKRIVERDDIEWEAGVHGVVGDQRYDDLREERRLPHDYGSRSYIDERHLADRDRDWIRESEMGRTDDRGIYDRTMDRHVGREWDRAETSHALPRDNYVDNREWSGGGGGMNDRQWDNKGKWQQQQEEEENWDEDDSKWQDYNRLSDTIHHEGGIGAAIGNMGMNDVQRGGPNRRWNSWRGRRGSQHHSGDFRRQQDGIFQHDRSSMVYRRPPDVVPTETISQSNAVEAVTIHPTTVTSIQPSLTPKSDVSVSAVVAWDLGQQSIAKSTLLQVAAAEIKVDETKDDVIDEISVLPDEQLLEEVIPDDLSEFSDEADEILNRQEEDDLGIVSSSCEKQSSLNQLDQHNFNHFSDERDLYGGFRPDYEPELLEKQNSQIDFNAPIDQSVETATAIDPVKDAEPLSVEKQLTPIDSKADLTEVKDIPEELDLDFEEISDGELEEEARIRGLGDALGVDWASLVEESKAIAREKSISTQTSAKQRWQPHSILLDVGISHKWAGKALAYKILNDAQLKQKKERELEKMQSFKTVKPNDGMVKVKEEKLDADYGDIQESTVSAALNVGEIKKEENSVPYINHPIASVQVGKRSNIDARKNLVFKATGPFSRALSARSDLQMRRVLCGLPKREIGCFEAVQKTDPAYTTLALSLFRRAIKETN